MQFFMTMIGLGMVIIYSYSFILGLIQGIPIAELFSYECAPFYIISIMFMIGCSLLAAVEIIEYFQCKKKK